MVFVGATVVRGVVVTGVVGFVIAAAVDGALVVVVGLVIGCVGADGVVVSMWCLLVPLSSEVLLLVLV